MLYEPRLGKTVLASAVCGKAESPVILVICPKNALFVWADHIVDWIKKFRPNIQIHTAIVKAKGTYKAIERRRQLWALTNAQVNVFITTFATFKNDWEYLKQQKRSFHTVLFDEFQKYLQSRGKQKDDKSKRGGVLFNIFKEVCASAQRFHFLSGTSVTKGPQNLWVALHLCNPQLFSSYWKFVHMFCEVIEGRFGKEIVGLRNLHNFHLLLRTYARIRRREECAPWIPKVQRQLVKIEMSADQQKMYNDLERDDYISLENGNVVITSSSMEQVIRFRQMLVCPKILDPSLDYGAGIEYIIDELAEAETDEDKHVVIFTPFKPALQYIDEALRAAGHKNIEHLYGGIDPEDLRLRISKFRSTKGIIICTTKYAQAFSLDSSTLCYHLGCEWTPNDNKQAEDRLVPQQGDFHIIAKYITHYNSIDSNVVSYLNNYQGVINATLQPT